MKDLNDEVVLTRWFELERKILLYAAREDRKAVKFLLAKYNDGIDEDTPGL